MSHAVECSNSNVVDTARKLPLRMGGIEPIMTFDNSISNGGKALYLSS